MSQTCDRAKLTKLGIESRQFAATAPAFNLPHLHLAPPEKSRLPKFWKVRFMFEARGINDPLVD